MRRKCWGSVSARGNLRQASSQCHCNGKQGRAAWLRQPAGQQHRGSKGFGCCQAPSLTCLSFTRETESFVEDEGVVKRLTGLAASSSSAHFRPRPAADAAALVQGGLQPPCFLVHSSSTSLHCEDLCLLTTLWS